MWICGENVERMFIIISTERGKMSIKGLSRQGFTERKLMLQPHSQ